MTTTRTQVVRFLVPLLLLAPGCAALRAQVGLGFGVGADVQVLGFQHVGVLLGKFHEWGPNYGRGTYCKTGYTVLGPYHATSMTFDEDEATGETRAPIEHGCYGFFPGPTGLLSDEPAAERWALEVGIAMTFVELRFGFNPLAPIFNVDDEPTPAGPQPQPQPQPQPRPQQAPAATAATAPVTPTNTPTTQVTDDRPRTYGGEAQEAPAPAAPPPPPPPPAAKQAPPGPSPAEEATGDVQLPSEERPAEAEAEDEDEHEQAPPASDER